MYKSIFFLAFILNLVPAHANNEVQKLLDSYLVAKADTDHIAITDSEAKKAPYTIQVASYINEKDAVSHMEELKIQEKQVHYFPSFVRGQVWFKVCVGQFSTKDQAEKYRKEFTRRMDEPFSTVISLLERPSKSSDARMPASTQSPPEIVKQSEKIGSTETSEGPQIRLIKKSATNHKKESAQYYYSIQVGSYPSKDIAKAEMAKLPIKDQSVFYEAAMVHGKKWYRLFVGKFSSKKEAETFQRLYNEQVQNKESFIRRMTASTEP